MGDTVGDRVKQLVFLSYKSNAALSFVPPAVVLLTVFSAHLGVVPPCLNSTDLQPCVSLHKVTHSVRVSSPVDNSVYDKL